MKGSFMWSLRFLRVSLSLVFFAPTGVLFFWFYLFLLATLILLPSFDGAMFFQNSIMTKKNV